MNEPDEVMVKIGRGVELSHAGERDAARQLFFEVWSDLGSKDSDPFHRCAVAHAMADVQDDPREELTWILRALQAADLITDERAAHGRGRRFLPVAPPQHWRVLPKARAARPGP